VDEQGSALSERESEILRLLATGASNKDIAVQLSISPNTVKVHLRNIFNKIGVTSRTEAALYALHNGVATGASESPDVSALPFEPAESLPPLNVPSKNRFWLLAGGVMLAIFLGVGLWISGIFPSSAQAAKPLPQKTNSSRSVEERWQNAAVLPEGREGAAGAVYEEGLYLAGGETSGGISASMMVYSPAQKGWQLRAAKPTPVRDASAAVLGERIFVAGGKGADGKPSNHLEVYDPRADRWETRAVLPRPLSGAALAASEGSLYLFGGWDGQQARAEVYRYDAQENRWTEMTPLPGLRMFSAAVTVEGKILVCGGTDGRRALVETLNYYPQRDRQGESPWEMRAPLPEGRYAAGAAALAGQVFVIGGALQGEIPAEQILAYQPQTNQWVNIGKAPQPAGPYSSVSSLEMQLHVTGGRQNGKPSALHQTYQALYTLLFPLIP
jgi:DNA-binding CsgD family transcriptional regulator/N-acetylneuraminic acid mutarotase